MAPAPQVFEIAVHFGPSGSPWTPTYACVPHEAHEDGIPGIVYIIVGLPADFINASYAALRSGEAFISVPGGHKDRASATLIVPPGADVTITVRDPRMLRSRRLSIKKTGSSSVLVLRVSASDSQVTSSLSSLSDKWFGTSGDSMNLKSQYTACSNNQLDFNAASGPGSIIDGVVEIGVGISAGGSTSTAIQNAATTAATALLGSLDQWDHVAYCLPSGTSGNWVAYAYLNYGRAVFNNDWCTYPSAQIHE